MRKKSGHVEPNFSSFSELMKIASGQDDHVYVGIVVKRDGDDKHFEVTQGEDGIDVLVSVDLMPEEVPISARLCSFATVGWKVPPEGSEVLVIVPGGRLNNAGFIVACGSSQVVPDELDETTYVMKNTAGDIRIIAGGCQVHIVKDGNIDITTPEHQSVNLNGSTYPMMASTNLLGDMAQFVLDVQTGSNTGGPVAFGSQASINQFYVNLIGASSGSFDPSVTYVTDKAFNG